MFLWDTMGKLGMGFGDIEIYTNYGGEEIELWYTMNGDWSVSEENILFETKDTDGAGFVSFDFVMGETGEYLIRAVRPSTGETSNEVVYEYIP